MTKTPLHAARPARAASLFDIVLHQPEIPNNTGNIGRTCVATGCRLHLIHPLGFEVSEKACRRAGLDYWPRLEVVEHATFDAYDAAGRAATPPPRRWYFSTKATRQCFDVRFSRGDHLVFGRETAGLPEDILQRWPEQCVRLPMVPHERSLNLATAVCAVVYLAIRDVLDSGDVRIDQRGDLVV